MKWDENELCVSSNKLTRNLDEFGVQFPLPDRPGDLTIGLLAPIIVCCCIPSTTFTTTRLVRRRPLHDDPARNNDA